MNAGRGAYDPFAPGPHLVANRTFEADDVDRGRRFPVDTWTPSGAHSDPLPLVLFSHFSGGSRRSSTFLCTHLASHGYAVAAMDHSEVVAPELSRRDGETPEQRASRVREIIASRVPDVRFLLDHMLGRGDYPIDSSRIGLVGHSFGGWTALATPESEPRISSVVALAPGGSARPRPGIIPSTLTFDWAREVPILVITGDSDVPVPLENAIEVFERARTPKRMFVMRRADHQHFVDDVEGEHEAVRTATFPGDASWIPPATLPIGELMTGEDAHRIVRGLTLAHFDATLRADAGASVFLDGDSTDPLVYRYER